MWTWTLFANVEHLEKSQVDVEILLRGLDFGRRMVHCGRVYDLNLGAFESNVGAVRIVQSLPAVSHAHAEKLRCSIRTVSAFLLKVLPERGRNVAKRQRKREVEAGKGYPSQVKGDGKHDEMEKEDCAQELMIFQIFYVCLCQLILFWDVRSYGVYLVDDLQEG